MGYTFNCCVMQILTLISVEKQGAKTIIHVGFSMIVSMEIVLSMMLSHGCRYPNRIRWTERRTTMTKMQKRMLDMGVSIRNLSELTGEATALVCYIARGLAHFQTFDSLYKACLALRCTPEDLFRKRDLETWYPDLYPKQQRKPRQARAIQIPLDIAEDIEALGLDVKQFVQDAVLQRLEVISLDAEGKGS